MDPNYSDQSFSIAKERKQRSKRLKKRTEKVKKSKSSQNDGHCQASPLGRRLEQTVVVLGRMQEQLSDASHSWPSSTSESEAVSDKSGQRRKLSSAAAGRSRSHGTIEEALKLVTAARSSALKVVEGSSQQSMFDVVKHIVRLEDILEQIRSQSMEEIHSSSLDKMEEMQSQVMGKMKEIQSQVRSNERSIEEQKGLATDGLLIAEGTRKEFESCWSALRSDFVAWVKKHWMCSQHKPKRCRRRPIRFRTLCKKYRPTLRSRQVSQRQIHSDRGTGFHQAEVERSSTNFVCDQQQHSNNQKQLVATSSVEAHIDPDSGSKEESTCSEDEFHHRGILQVSAVSSTWLSDQDHKVAVGGTQVICSTNDTVSATSEELEKIQRQPRFGAVVGENEKTLLSAASDSVTDDQDTVSIIENESGGCCAPTATSLLQGRKVDLPCTDCSRTTLFPMGRDIDEDSKVDGTQRVCNTADIVGVTAEELEASQGQPGFGAVVGENHTNLLSATSISVADTDEKGQYVVSYETYKNESAGRFAPTTASLSQDVLPHAQTGIGDCLQVSAETYKETNQVYFVEEEHFRDALLLLQSLEIFDLFITERGKRQPLGKPTLNENDGIDHKSMEEVICFLLSCNVLYYPFDLELLYGSIFSWLSDMKCGNVQDRLIDRDNVLQDKQDQKRTTPLKLLLLDKQGQQRTILELLLLCQPDKQDQERTSLELLLLEYIEKLFLATDNIAAYTDHDELDADMLQAKKPEKQVKMAMAISECKAVAEVLSFFQLDRNSNADMSEAKVFPKDRYSQILDFFKCDDVDGRKLFHYLQGAFKSDKGGKDSEPERKLTSEKLNDSNSLFATSLVDSDVFCSMDLNGCQEEPIQTINHTNETIRGFSSQDAIMCANGLGNMAARDYENYYVATRIAGNQARSFADVQTEKQSLDWLHQMTSDLSSKLTDQIALPDTEETLAETQEGIVSTISGLNSASGTGDLVQSSLPQLVERNPTEDPVGRPGQSAINSSQESFMPVSTLESELLKNCGADDHSTGMSSVLELIESQTSATANGLEGDRPTTPDRNHFDADAMHVDYSKELDSNLSFNPSVHDTAASFPAASENDLEQSTIPPADGALDAVSRANNFTSRSVKEGGRKIGAGSFGEVFHAHIPVANGNVQEVAIKKIKQPTSDKQSKISLNRRQFPTEVMALTRCRHPNIGRLIGECTEGPELCLVFEYLPGGNLTSLLAKSNPDPPVCHVRLRILHNVAQALKYLHTSSNQLVHRDIKRANVLVAEGFEGKLADFGLAIPVEDDEDPFASFLVTSAVGTRSYMAPEAFKGTVSPRADIYSFGMVIYEVVTGLPPYSAVKKKNLVTFMREMERQGSDLAVMMDPRANWPLEVAADLLKLARWCTDYDSHKRPPISVVVSILEMLLRDYPSPSEQPF